MEDEPQRSETIKSENSDPLNVPSDSTTAVEIKNDEQYYIKDMLVLDDDNAISKEPKAPKREPKNNETKKESDSLILTADEELKTQSSSSSQHKRKKIKMEAEVATAKDTYYKKSESARKSEAQNASKVLWILNISSTVKATELKQFVSKSGRVLAAKIVTDGKKCYGYVVMENVEEAKECLKTLNNTYLDGKKITISMSRPAVETKPNDCEEIKTNKDSNNEKRRRSNSRSSELIRRRSSDPLTTKFGRWKGRSPSVDNYDQHFREKLERDRLKRQLLEEQRRNREEMNRQIHREERHRHAEFRLEQERRKLQLERELFEKERRELMRLDVERRKIERERLEILQERTKLEEELQQSRAGRKDEFNMSSIVVKPWEASKRKEREESFRRSEQKIKINEAKGESSKSSKREDYERNAPPLPKLYDEFDLSTRKSKHLQHSERKIERGSRKIEVIDRKYYAKDFDRKSYRKLDYAKRDRDEAYSDQKNAQRYIPLMIYCGGSQTF